jgi:uncharacterized protein (TIGR03067 family)
MRRVTVGLVLAAALGIAASPKEDAGKKDLEKMQGDWTAESMERDGMKLEADDAQAFFRTVKGNSYTVHRYSKKISAGTFRLDATKTPRTIDFMPDFPAKGKAILGIYRLDGDKLTLCYPAPGQPRPKEFSAKEGTGNTVAVWVREKKTK